MLGLHRCGVGEVVAPARADLDLGVDQLARGGHGKELVLLTRLHHRRELVCELERVRVDDRELLLEPDREVLRGLEDLPCASEVEPRVLAHR